MYTPVNLLIGAGDKVTLATTVALEAVTSMPASTDAIALFPLLLRIGYGDDVTYGFMSRDARESTIATFSNKVAI